MDEQEKMINDFQCPGCVSGISPEECDTYSFQDTGWGFRCSGHCPGTIMSPGGVINLGLPQGFNKVSPPTEYRKTNIRLSLGELNSYDHLNIPVWAYDRNGYLFVRVVSPRIDQNYVDIVKGRTIDDLRKVYPKGHIYNVADFIDDID
jgi:hypothetical protein